MNLRRYYRLKPDETDPNKPANIRDAPPETADLISSELAQGETWHLPVFDIDYDAELRPSSSQGKFHLFLNRPVPWSKYVKVLEAMADAGLLEPGWVDCAKKTGYALVRAKPTKGKDKLGVKTGGYGAT